MGRPLDEMLKPIRDEEIQALIWRVREIHREKKLEDLTTAQ